jgi:hypothetical protein
MSIPRISVAAAELCGIRSKRVDYAQDALTSGYGRIALAAAFLHSMKIGTKLMRIKPVSKRFKELVRTHFVGEEHLPTNEDFILNR